MLQSPKIEPFPIVQPDIVLVWRALTSLVGSGLMPCLFNLNLL